MKAIFTTNPVTGKEYFHGFTEEKTFRVVANYSTDMGTWTDLVGVFMTMEAAERALYEYARIHQYNCYLDNLQILDD